MAETKWEPFESDPDRCYLTAGELIDALVRLDRDIKVKACLGMEYHDTCDMEVERDSKGKITSVAILV